MRGAPAPDLALDEKLNYRLEGMVHTINNLIFNFFSPTARTRLSNAILPARLKLRPDQDSADMLFDPGQA